MVKFFDSIPPEINPWIEKQHMFWVATAPLNPEGHVNVSPKGVKGTFYIVDSNKVYYEDLSGSGVETISHLRENGRITIMFQAFEGPPRICRLFGKGTVHEFGTPEYESLIPLATRKPGSRGAIVIDVHKVSTSCGYAVPYFKFISHRDILLNFFQKREDDDTLKDYWVEKNLQSIDGVPGLQYAPNCSAQPKTVLDKREWVTDVKMVKRLMGEDGGDGVKASASTRMMGGKGEWATREEARLLLAFSMGVLVCAVYVQMAGVA